MIGVSFPGINQVKNCTIAVGNGILPGVALLYINPQPSIPFAIGTLQITDGTNIVRLFDCAVDESTLAITHRGHISKVRLFDRRWKWKFGEINGSYNNRNADGTVDPTNEKTPQELAALCFQAMGETGYDVSALPNSDRPFVEWESEVPAVALADLCANYGCEVSLDVPSNRARIVRLGEGQPLPTNGVKSIANGMGIGEIPDRIRARSAPTVYQARVKLKAVGIDTDGSIKPIDDLSYAPDGGWSQQDPNELLPEADAGAPERVLANTSVYRMYQVDTFSDGTLNVPGYGAIARIEQILPLKSQLAEDYESSGQSLFGKGPYITGRVQVESAVETIQNTDATYRVESPFTLKRDQGIVVFGKPVYKLRGTSQLDGYEPAELYLTCAFNVHHHETRAALSYSLERVLASNGTQPLVHRADNITRRIIAAYQSDGTTVDVDNIDDNLVTVDAALNIVLDGIEFELLPKTAYTVHYNHIALIALDGSRRQVVWRVHYKEGASTTAHWNTEGEMMLPRRRDRERARHVEKERRKSLQKMHSGGIRKSLGYPG